jgi:hypothetical protein
MVGLKSRSPRIHLARFVCGDRPLTLRVSVYRRRRPLPQGERAQQRAGRASNDEGAPYSQYQVEKSFSYCGTSFQTPFSFLAVMVMSCGWYM